MRLTCGARGSPLPELEVQYVDYAIWQRRWIEGEVLQEHVEYWKRQPRRCASAASTPNGSSKAHSREF